MTIDHKIAKLLEQVDFSELIDRMEVYARLKLKGQTEKDLEGQDILDFVFTVIEKSLRNVRNWDKETCPSFDRFLFGCLKSEISDFYRRKKNRGQNVDSSHLLNISQSPKGGKSIDNEIIKSETISSLERYGADENEIMVFECWTEGTLKPSEIAEILELEVPEIYNIKKRLIKKLSKVKPYIQQLL